jgi:hypothetical protein
VGNISEEPRAYSDPTLFPTNAFKDETKAYCFSPSSTFGDDTDEVEQFVDAYTVPGVPGGQVFGALHEEFFPDVRLASFLLLDFGSFDEAGDIEPPWLVCEISIVGFSPQLIPVRLQPVDVDGPASDGPPSTGPGLIALPGVSICGCPENTGAGVFADAVAMRASKSVSLTGDERFDVSDLNSTGYGVEFVELNDPRANDLLLCVFGPEGSDIVCVPAPAEDGEGG